METVVERKKNKKAKVRSAWISFAGRIVAHVIGAVASVVLGLAVLEKYSRQDVVPPAPAANHLVRHRDARSGELAIAVLPLENYSADAKHGYLADGITEALTADLAQIPGLRVISRTSSMVYRGSSKPIPQISSELGVDLLLEGSVVRDEGRVRVTAQLIDGDSDEHLWAKSFDRDVRDLLSLQAEVATAIAREVKTAISARLAARARGMTDLLPAAALP